MTGPLSTLLGSSFRSWLSAKGFWLVVIAALLPAVLTGAWVASHRADIAATDLRIEGGPFTAGDNVHLVAVFKNPETSNIGNVNVTVAIGTVDALPDGRYAFRGVMTNQTTLENVKGGETREIAIDWVSEPGIYYALALADPDDLIGEREEQNNQQDRGISVGYATPTTPPQRPLGLDGNVTSTDVVDLAVANLDVPASSPALGANVTFSATFANRGATDVANAQGYVRVMQVFDGRPTEIQRTPVASLNLSAGATSEPVTLTWTAREGAFWVEAYVLPPEGTREATPEDNDQASALTVSPPSDFGTPPTPPDRPTLKLFYLALLGQLYLRMVLPLIALFYAAGVIADERDQGALPYLLTRPIPRWIIPITKFIASFAVAAVAVIIGVAITYMLLFGTASSQTDIGFLTTPLLASLLTLFAYGAFFTLLGTVLERPYLVGLLFLLGWETIATLTGNLFALASWARNLTITYHVQNAMAGWPLIEGVTWLPIGDNAIRGLSIALTIGVVALVASAVWMKQREFDVG